LLKKFSTRRCSNQLGRVNPNIINKRINPCLLFHDRVNNVFYLENTCVFPHCIASLRNMGLVFMWNNKLTSYLKCKKSLGETEPFFGELGLEPLIATW